MGRAVDDQPLDLVEHRRVGRVVIAAEGPPRHDDAQRRLLRLHRADLHGRGMGAQHQARAVRAWRQIERVVLLARGMVRRDVERGEIVEIVLDMRPLGDDETHLAEDRDDLVDGLADRMDRSRAAGQHRQGHIGQLAGEAIGQRGTPQPVAGFLERRGDRVPKGVQPRARLPALFCRKLAKPAHQRGNLAVAAEQLDADLLELLRRLRSGNRPQELIGFQCGIFHFIHQHAKRGRRIRPLWSQ